MNEFGRLLKEYRCNSTDPQCGGLLTQARFLDMLQEHTGVTYDNSMVSRWERGKRGISHDNRDLLVGMMKVLTICGGIRFIEEADKLLKVGKYAPLSENEIQQINIRYKQEPDRDLESLKRMPENIIPSIATLPIGSHLPYAINIHFVGRQEEMRQIVQAFKNDKTVAIGQMAGLTGWGGIGKTQLAVAFAHRYGQYFTGGVYWIDCANPDLISSEISNCAGAVKMPLPDFLNLDQPTRLRMVQHAWQQSIPRLLIFDNCGDPQLVTKWRPKTGGCRVLVTSRYSGWETGIGLKEIYLETLPLVESVTLLRQLAPRLNNKKAEQVAEAVGNFPLALYLAGSYLNQRPDQAVRDFLIRLEDKKLQHRAMQGKRMKHSPTNHVLSVAATFALSWEQLDSNDPIDRLAIELMSYAIHLAPNRSIPLDLILTIVINSCHDENKQNVMYTYEIQDEIQDALSRLMALGLTPPGELRLHRLIIDFVSEQYPLQNWNNIWNLVASNLHHEANKMNEAGHLTHLREWQTHLKYVTDNAPNNNVKIKAYLSSVLGFHMQANGNYEEALPYHLMSLEIMEEVIGNKHPDTILSLNNMGTLLQELGKYKEAWPYYQKAVDISLEILGEKHLSTALCLNNMGGFLEKMGEYKKALNCYQRALDTREEVLGLKHQTTASSLNNIGLLLERMGEYKNAQLYLERALNISLEVLGEKHLYTASSLHNVGGLFQTIGEYRKAQLYYQRSLNISIEVLGERHPKTAVSLNSMGFLLLCLGEYKLALSYYQQALDICVETFGKKHPDTAYNLSKIGEIQQMMGEYEKASNYYQCALNIQIETLGEKHTDTALSMSNMGRLLKKRGNLKKALNYYQDALNIQEEVLGKKHPTTASSLNNIGGVYQEMGDYKEALGYYQRALDIRVKFWEPNHPEMAQSLNNIGTLCHQMGEYKEALGYYQRALDIRVKILGEKHYNTALSLNNMGALCQEMGEYKEALDYYQRALDIRVKFLEPNHPDIAQSLNNMGTLLSVIESYKKAKKYYLNALKIFEKTLGHEHPNTKIVRENLETLLAEINTQKKP